MRSKGEISIVTQGAPEVSAGVVGYKKRRDIAIFEIDLRSKYCEVIAHFVNFEKCPGVMIDTSERSLHLHPTETGATVIEFPGFKGWSVFASGIGRYTLGVCLIKDTMGIWR